MPGEETPAVRASRAVTVLDRTESDLTTDQAAGLRILQVAIGFSQIWTEWPICARLGEPLYFPKNQERKLVAIETSARSGLLSIATRQPYSS